MYSERSRDRELQRIHTAHAVARQVVKNAVSNVRRLIAQLYKALTAGWGTEEGVFVWPSVSLRLDVPKRLYYGYGRPVATCTSTRPVKYES